MNGFIVRGKWYHIGILRTVVKNDERIIQLVALEKFKADDALKIIPRSAGIKSSGGWSVIFNRRYFRVDVKYSVKENPGFIPEYRDHVISVRDFLRDVGLSSFYINEVENKKREDEKKGNENRRFKNLSSTSD